MTAGKNISSSCPIGTGTTGERGVHPLHHTPVSTAVNGTSATGCHGDTVTSHLGLHWALLKTLPRATAATTTPRSILRGAPIPPRPSRRPHRTRLAALSLSFAFVLLPSRRAALDTVFP